MKLQLQRFSQIFTAQCDIPDFGEHPLGFKQRQVFQDSVVISQIRGRAAGTRGIQHDQSNQNCNNAG
jgi:hypothetical protein